MGKIKKAGALILDDKKMMIVKQLGRPFFINPGGKYECGETAEDCLKRELQEELGVEVRSYKYYKTYEMPKADHNSNSLSLELYIVEIEEEPEPLSEIEKIEWMSKEDFENEKYNLAPSFQKFVPDLIKDGIL